MLQLQSSEATVCLASLKLARPVNHSIRASFVSLAVERQRRPQLLGGIILDTPMKVKRHPFPQVAAKYPVTVFTVDGHQEGETQLINNQGALIRCQHPPRLRETATISIELSERESLMVEAEVMLLHFHPHSDSHDVAPSGMVVRFKNLSSVGRQRLRTVIARHYENKLKRLAAKN
jgi:hypothetical protein